MVNQQQSVERVFGEALDLPPEQRRQYLNRVCVSAPQLRRRVEELLAADERAGSFLGASLLHFPHDQMGPADELPSLTADLPALKSASGPPRFGPSELIASRFVVVRFIARGGMGEVYEVEDRLLQSAHVALKIIRPEIAAEADSSHRFEQEVILARKVIHPNLCPIYDIFHCDQPAPPFLFLTMKLLHGETLEARLQRAEPLPRHEVVEICKQLVGGVAAVHAAGIVHRDIKPNNVMLERSGTRICVFIMDFGLARLHESEATVLRSGMIAGTPGYLAPELLQGHRPTQSTDIFALGIVLHQVLTGERPLEARDGISLTPAPSLKTADAPLHLIHSVSQFLSNDPEQRCRAFEQLHVIDHSPVAPSLQPQPSLLTRRNFIIGAGASSCALAVTAAWKRNGIYDLLHPLPSKRFVAVLDWPPASDTRIRPMVMGLIDAVASELARAEAFDRNFYVAAQTSATEMKTPTQLNEVRKSLGANLVLATSGISAANELRVLLQVLEPSSGRTLRSKEIRAHVDQQFALPQRVVRAAAELLNVSHYEPDDRRTRIATENPEALHAFQAAEALMKQPNNAGLEEAIEKYRSPSIPIAISLSRTRISPAPTCCCMRRIATPAPWSSPAPMPIPPSASILNPSKDTLPSGLSTGRPEPSPKLCAKWVSLYPLILLIPVP